MQRVTLQYVFIIFLSIGCRSQQYTYQELPAEQIVFGQSGMAGEIKTYVLLENGQLFVFNSLTKIYEELKKIRKKQARDFFVKMEEMSFNNMNFDHPGNRYYFLGQKDKKGEYKAVWGSENHKVPELIREMYNKLKGIIK